MGKTKSRDDSQEEKRSKKKHKKEKKKKHERSSKKKKSKDKLSSPDAFGPLPPPKLPEASNSDICGPSLPETAPKAKSFAPMSKEDWERQQSVIRRVYDEETGRSRLVKGDGEILEEIVSRDRHKEINRKATLGDGQHFQSVINQNVKK